jgi:hypothetical protein
MVEFRQKQFGIVSSVKNGAAIGATVGTLATKLPIIKNLPIFKKKDDSWKTELSIIGGGTIIGAGLGLLVGLTKDISTRVNRATTVDARLMQGVIENLKKDGFKEGIDYTRDPKTANDLKIKVCIVISKSSGNMQLLVNTVADTKLKTVALNMAKNIPNTATVNTKLSDKYNDISISTISDSSANIGLVTGIAEYFIRNKYPVYLVEVG